MHRPLPSIEILMSRKAKEVSEISQVFFKSRVIRFGAVILTENLVLDKTYGNISEGGSHFSTHVHAIGLFEVVATE